MGIYDRDYYRHETADSLWITGKAPATFVLILVNVGVFLGQSFGGWDIGGFDLTQLLALVPQEVFERLQFWRLLTATFCHAGISHLLFNMLFLWWFGREIEKIYGSPEFLAYYLISAVFSSFVWGMVAWLRQLKA